MKRILLAALVGTTSVAGLFAQTAGEVIIDRVQQPPAPSAPDAATSSKSKDEKGDLDGGTQRIAEPRTLPFKLTFAYDIQAFHSTNVFLQPDKEVKSVVLANTLQTRAEFNSVTVGQTLLTPSINLIYQRYNHGLINDDSTHKVLDFDAYTLPIGLRLRFGDNWEANVGLTGTAVYSLEPSYDLTYKSVAANASLRKLLAIGDSQLFTAGLTVNLVKTDAAVPAGPLGYREDRNDKIDTAFDVGYYYLKGPWVLGSYARLTYSDYFHYQEGLFTDVDRRDLTTSLGLSATYTINKWASARAFTSADWRDPQGDSFVDYSYQNTNLGVGLTLTASF